MSRSWISRAALGLAFAAILMLIVAGPGYRLSWWGLGPAFTLFRYAAYGGVVAGLLGLVGMVADKGGRMASVGALVVGLAAFGIPFQFQRSAQTLPRIHDISTDTENPPEFMEVLIYRADSPSSAEYGGPDVAALQKEGYPDIETLVLDQPFDEAFENARYTAGAMGWDIVAAEPEAGRIEAIHTTFWFGFKDDVVVRLEPEGERTRVDVRSCSRVGRGDLGANAKRVRKFLYRLKAFPAG